MNSGRRYISRNGSRCRLTRFGNADRKELERASSAVRSDQWRGGRLGRKGGQAVREHGSRRAESAQFCRQAAAIFEGKAAQIQPGVAHGPLDHFRA